MKKEQHLIALDLDGTLLTDGKEISVFTKKVIQQVIDDGHIVVIATGRAHRDSIQYYHELELSTPMVNFNGALTRSEEHTSELQSRGHLVCRLLLEKKKKKQ